MLMRANFKTIAEATVVGVSDGEDADESALPLLSDQADRPPVPVPSPAQPVPTEGGRQRGEQQHSPVAAAAPADALPAPGGSPAGTPPEVEFDFLCFSAAAREARVRELSASALADGPYDDVLLSADVPPEILQNPEFRAAAACAREVGKCVTIRHADEPSSRLMDQLLTRRPRYVADVVSKEFANVRKYGAREVFDALWRRRGFEGNERDFVRMLDSLYDGMPTADLAEDCLYRVMRVNAARLNRQIGVIWAELAQDRAGAGPDVQMNSARLDAALAGLDKLSLQLARLAGQLRRNAKDGAGVAPGEDAR